MHEDRQEQPVAVPGTEPERRQGSIEATIDGRRIDVAQAIAVPVEDGRAILILSTEPKGCTALAEKGRAETVFGTVVLWRPGATTEVSKLDKWRDPYVIVYPGDASAPDNGRQDIPWSARGTIEVLETSGAADQLQRVRFDLHGSCCSLKGEIDARICDTDRGP